MKLKKALQNRIQGWFPQEPEVPFFKQMSSRVSSNKKLRLTVIIGVSIAVLIGSVVLVIAVMWVLNPIVPTDVQIIGILNENKNLLLSIDGVVGAGIARNTSDNHIIGINVYVEGNMTNIQDIPKQLGAYTVFIQNVNETTASQKDMIIHRADFAMKAFFPAFSVGRMQL